MYLTKWEEKALYGEFGEAISIAMNVLTKVCKALKARSLVEISHAHISGVSYFNIGDEGVEFLEDLVNKDAYVSIYTTLNPSSIASLAMFESIYDNKVTAKQKKIIKLFEKMGVDKKSFTCIPYKLRMPKHGEHLAWAESSAVIYANSVIGAKTNREGSIVSVMAAIAGRTCFCGMHLDEERYPTEIIEVEFPVESIAIASALGLYIGKIAKGIPYIRINIRLREKFREIAIRSMLASVASTSNLALTVIEGISPEAKNINNLASLEKTSIDFNEIERFIESGGQGIMYLGCPHIDLDEAREIINAIIDKLKDKGITKIYASIPLYEVNKLNSLVNSISGVEVVYLPGACLVVSKLNNITNFVSTIHGKAHHYIPKLTGIQTCLLNIA